MNVGATEMRETFEALEEDLFWNEAGLRLTERPPPEVEEALIEDLNFLPGQRAALAFFWGGLRRYSEGLQLEKKGEIEQVGKWLNRFKKAAKAKRRISNGQEVTDRDLDILSKAWADLDKTSKAFLGMYPPPYQQEEFNTFWIAGYYLRSTIACLKQAEEYYPRGHWTLGDQTEWQRLPTKAANIEYDRLLFRSYSVTFSSFIQEHDHLPDTPEGWILAYRDFKELFAFPSLKQDSVDEATVFTWPDKAFQLTLSNGWRLIIEAGQKHPHEENHYFGLVHVHTPSGMFFEQYVLDHNYDFFAENIERTFLGNSWTCQPGLGDNQMNIKKSIRSRIIEEVAVACSNPAKKEPLPDLTVQVPLKKTKIKASKLVLPKGNLLYGSID